MQDDFRIKEYGEALQLLDDLRKQVESGEIMSILAVAERTDGAMQMASTGTQHVYSLFGYMFACGMSRMGFVQDEKLKGDPQ